MYLLWVFHELFALGDQVLDNGSLGFKLSKWLFLSLNQLFDVFNTAGSDVTSGAEHDSVQEFNMRFQLITESVTFPVKIDFDLSFGYSWDKVLVFLNEGFQFLVLHSLLIFAPFCHQDFQNVDQPFLDIRAFQILAQSLKMKGKVNDLLLSTFTW